MKNTLLTVGLALSIASCQTTSNNVTKKPTNIILMIGDGMGLSQVSAAYYFQEDSSNFSRFPIVGLSNTSSTSKITDSAAGATAFSTGVTTYNGAIAVDSDSIELETITEILSDQGWNTGMIATSTIQHATPASFYAHNKSRGAYPEITVDLIKSEIDFFAGGGGQYFSQRKDSLNLLDSLSSYGFTWNINELSKKLDPAKKYGFLLSDSAMASMSAGRGSFLTDASNLAIDYFTSSKESFFLMIEGSQIDWGGHSRNADYLIEELLDFDQVIGAVLDFAEADGNTLVIVTADHETGGFTMSAKEGNYNEINPVFSTRSHSSTLVPVFAFGPGAVNFSGVYRNTAIFDKMMKALEK